jgi:hypothetical protein
MSLYSFAKKKTQFISLPIVSPTTNQLFFSDARAFAKKLRDAKKVFQFTFFI